MTEKDRVKGKKQATNPISQIVPVKVTIHYIGDGPSPQTVSRACTSRPNEMTEKHSLVHLEALWVQPLHHHPEKLQ